jgi:hypothetical protein
MDPLSHMALNITTCIVLATIKSLDSEGSYLPVVLSKNIHQLTNRGTGLQIHKLQIMCKSDG